MPIYGTLRTMPLQDLLQWIGQAHRTGTLHVERDRVGKWILFHDGRIVTCRSDAPTARLGHFLLAQGRITEDQLRRALDAQESSGKQLGGLFVEMGALTDVELASHLRAQGEETVLSLFDSADATFRFDETLTDLVGYAVELEIGEVVTRGAERVAKLAAIRDVFPDHQVVLGPGRQVPPAAVLQNPMAGHLFDAIDGSRTIAEILLHVHGSEFMVTRFMFELHRAGFLAIVSKPTGAPVQAPVAPLVPEVAASAPPAVAQPMTIAAPAHPALEEAVVDGLAQAFDQVLESAVAPGGATVDPTTALNAPQPPVDDPIEDRDWADEMLDEHAEILDIPEVFAESSDVEALDDSIAHKVNRQLEQSRNLLSAGNFEEALISLEDLYQRFPDDDALRRMLAEAEAAFKDQAYRHYVPAHMIPTLKTPLGELESQNLSPTEFFLLSRIDGTWDIKSIIQVAPIREIEALITLKRMREQGMIELRDSARQ